MTDRTVRVRVLAELPGYGAAMRGGAADTALLGEAATAAGRGVRALGVDAAAARGGLTGLASGARGGAVAVGEAEAASVRAGRGVRAAGVEADAARGAFGRIGEAARTGLGTVRSWAESAFDSMKHMGTLLAGGALLYGLHDIVHMGNEYTDAMNKYLEVTRASGAQMAAAGREAQALGADLKLPSVTAAEAADAMVELAKAGLSAQDAVKAARGTVQLAAAARTDVATAAKIEGDIMDQFALKSSEATHVADVLGNTSNAASGELMDMYYAMKYVGPIAHTMGISIADTATAVGLLGKSGIIGETAGTALRSALVNMAKPTKQATEGLHALGIEAFDKQGQFKGLEYVITQLGTAQQHMSTEQFTAAAAMAFGKPALAAMVALAHQGGPAFEQFGQQVGRVGGAAALAAAESKGLGGAMRGLGKEISSAFLQIYLAIAPGLEKVTRAFSSTVASAIPYIKDGVRIATDLWDIYGPSVEKKLGTAASGIGREAQKLVKPLESELTGLAVSAVPIAITAVDKLEKKLTEVVNDVRPVASGLHAMYDSAVSSGGALQTLSGRLQVGVGFLAYMAGGLGNVTAVLRPLGEMVGALAHAFSELPGPVQLSVISMLALRPFRPQIQALQETVTGYGRSAVSAFQGVGASMDMQRAVASHYGIELSRTGAAFAAIEARIPVVRAMGETFRGASGGVTGFTRALGVGAGAGLMGAFKGLYSFLGGPWGIAIAAVSAGLDFLAKRQQQAAAAAEAHRARISSLTQALEQSHGVIDASVRATAVQTLSDAKLKDGKTQLLDVMHKAGVSTTELTNAYLGQGSSLDQLHQRLADAADENQRLYQSHQITYKTFLEQQIGIKAASDALGPLNGEVAASVSRNKDLADAVKGSGSAAMDATNPTGRLKDAIATLGNSEASADDKARALHQALQLLSGGELDVQAAVAQQNQALLDLNATYKDGVDQSKGYKDALLQVDGSLNTSSENGQALWTKLQALNEQTAGAAQATFDYAKTTGSLSDALAAAEAPMQKSWEAAVNAGQQFGLTADQAKTLAAQMGFIPSSLAITMSTPGMTDTQKQLLYVQGLADHLPKDSKMKVSALTDEARKALTDIGFQINDLPGGRQVEITAPSDKAQASLNEIINRLAGIHDKTVTVTFQSDGTVTIPGSRTRMSLYANGGIEPGTQGRVAAFASGSERHVAQIARPGAMRLWAEPETGGEAYIPLSPAKRVRSMAILGHVAAEFGQQLVPAARDLIPARQVAISGGASSTSYDHSRTNHLHLYGAQQSSAEQRADLMRHLEYVS